MNKKIILKLFLILVFLGLFYIGFNFLTGNGLTGFNSLTPYDGDIKCEDCNVLLITIDAARPDHLGLYGYDRPTSPNIDRLADDSVVFTNALTVVVHTLEVLSSMLTGLYPHTHMACEGTPLDHDFVTLPEVLEEHGYYTAGVTPVANFNSSNSNLDQGFYTFLSADGSLTAQKITPDWSAWSPYLAASTIAENANRFIDTVNNVPNGKFFIWLHFWDVHFPFNPPPEYGSVWYKDYIDFSRITDPSNPSLKNPINQGDVDAAWVQDLANFNGQKVTDVNVFTTAYDAQIAYVDDSVGGIIDKLKELNLDEKTIVIVSADHGISINEHRYFFNVRDYVYDEELKIPLIVKIPGVSKKVIDYQVQIIDFFPTILGLLGIKSEVKFEGKDMFESGTEYAFSENWDCSAGANPNCYPSGLAGKLKAVRTEEWKMIRTPTRQGYSYELYNLKDDPRELNNVIDTNLKVAEKLKKLLEDYTSDEDYTGQKEMNELDDTLKDHLKSLGYMH